MINKEAIHKLKSLIEDIMVCLFCTNLKTDDGSTCRPMTALKICDQSNIWFFNEKDSEKNKAIEADKNVFIKGVEVEIIEEKENWLHIRYYGKKTIEGWIKKSDVE